MNARKIGKYWHAWFNRREEPPNGRLVSMRSIVGFPVTQKKDADQIMRDLRRNWHKRKLIELTRGKAITLDAFRQEYISNRQDKSPDTLRADSLALRSLGDVIGHSIQIRMIDIRKIDMFKRMSLDRGLSPVSLSNYLRHVRAALNSAVEYGYLDKCPKIKMPEMEKKLPRILEPEEIKRILENAKTEDYEMWRIIHFTLWTACRRSEIISLKWECFTDDDMCSVRGKGNKTRRIAIQPEAKTALQPKMDIGPVFKQWHKDTISKRFHKICESCGIPNARFHDLRHTAATHMLRNGIKIEVIQKILGHADIRTTQIYAHVQDELIRKEMGKLKY
jgi:integrase